MIKELMFALTLAGSPLTGPEGRRAAIAAAIKDIDSSDWTIVEQGLFAVQRLGCDAVPALVRDLQVVKYWHIYPEEAPIAFADDKVRKRIMALRYITGLDMTTKLRPHELRGYKDFERTWLTFQQPKSQVMFFGHWMSRGHTYFAPESVQRRIIWKWRQYAASGKCHAHDWGNLDTGDIGDFVTVGGDRPPYPKEP